MFLQRAINIEIMHVGIKKNSKEISGYYEWNAKATSYRNTQYPRWMIASEANKPPPQHTTNNLIRDSLRWRTRWRQNYPDERSVVLVYAQNAGTSPPWLGQGHELPAAFADATMNAYRTSGSHCLHVIPATMREWISEVRRRGGNFLASFADATRRNNNVLRDNKSNDRLDAEQYRGFHRHIFKRWCITMNFWDIKCSLLGNIRYFHEGVFSFSFRYKRRSYFYLRNLCDIIIDYYNA